MTVFELERKRWDPKKTLECGQFFHWYGDEKEYRVVYGKEFARIRMRGDRVTVILPETADQVKWRHFLNPDAEYDFSSYESDERVQPAIEYGRGLTLLRQDPFVCIVSFILSANNHFKRIQFGVRQMAAQYGEPIGEDAYSFPEPRSLAGISPSELRAGCNTGYRDEYIVKTAQRIADGAWDPEKPFRLATDDARKTLMQLPGVGPKVADCILLFAYEKPDTFPVDVWMHRTMQVLFWDRPATRKEVFEDAIRRFGKDAGLIQQLLFYYGKSEKIGVSTDLRKK